MPAQTSWTRTGLSSRCSFWLRTVQNLDSDQQLRGTQDGL